MSPSRERGELKRKENLVTRMLKGTGLIDKHRRSRDRDRSYERRDKGRDGKYSRYRSRSRHRRSPRRSPTRRRDNDRYHHREEKSHRRKSDERLEIYRKRSPQQLHDEPEKRKERESKNLDQLRIQKKKEDQFPDPKERKKRSRSPEEKTEDKKSPSKSKRRRRRRRDKRKKAQENGAAPVGRDDATAKQGSPKPKEAVAPKEDHPAKNSPDKLKPTAKKPRSSSPKARRQIAEKNSPAREDSLGKLSENQLKHGELLISQIQNIIGSPGGTQSVGKLSDMAQPMSTVAEHNLGALAIQSREHQSEFKEKNETQFTGPAITEQKALSHYRIKDKDKAEAADAEPASNPADKLDQDSLSSFSDDHVSSSSQHEDEAPDTTSNQRSKPELKLFGQEAPAKEAEVAMCSQSTMNHPQNLLCQADFEESAGIQPTQSDQVQTSNPLPSGQTAKEKEDSNKLNDIIEKASQSNLLRAEATIEAGLALLQDSEIEDSEQAKASPPKATAETATKEKAGDCKIPAKSPSDKKPSKKDLLSSSGPSNPGVKRSEEKPPSKVPDEVSLNIRTREDKATKISKDSALRKDRQDSRNDVSMDGQRLEDPSRKERREERDRHCASKDKTKDLERKMKDARRQRGSSKDREVQRRHDRGDRGGRDDRNQAKISPEKHGRKERSRSKEKKRKRARRSSSKPRRAHSREQLKRRKPSHDSPRRRGEEDPSKQRQAEALFAPFKPPTSFDIETGSWDDFVRFNEFSDEAMYEKQVLEAASRERGAHIEVRLFIRKVPSNWQDRDVFQYFKRFANILEARVNQESEKRTVSALIKCLNFHEALTIQRIHREKECHLGDLRDRTKMRSSPDKKRRSLEDYQQMSAFSYQETEINPLFQVLWADGELERLGIVNVDPFDMNGQSKLYARFVRKNLSKQQLHDFFSEFGEVAELFTFADDVGYFNGTCFVKFNEREQAIDAITVLNNKCANAESARKIERIFHNTFRSKNDRNPPYNDHVARIVEEGKKFEIKFAEKKRKDKDTYLQQLYNKDAGFRERFEHILKPKEKQGEMAFAPLMNPFGMHAGGDMMTMLKMFQQYQYSQQQQKQQGQPNLTNFNAFQAWYQQQFNPLLGQTLGFPMAPQQMQMAQMQPMQQMQQFGQFAMFPQFEAFNMFKQFQKQFDQQPDKPKLIESKSKKRQLKEKAKLDVKGPKLSDILEHKERKERGSRREKPKLTQPPKVPLQQSLSQYALKDPADFEAAIEAINGGNLGLDDETSLGGGFKKNSNFKKGPDGANLFVFHIPNEWSDLDLFLCFHQHRCGKILSLRIMTEDGHSKGFGFVSYETPEQAQLAIEKVDGQQALGKRLKVQLKNKEEPSSGHSRTGFSGIDKDRSKGFAGAAGQAGKRRQFQNDLEQLIQNETMGLGAVMSSSTNETTMFGKM